MKAIERVPIVQQVANNLREFILSGEAKVGEKLPTEMELCQDMGVGRGTVREALRILQAEGFVEIMPGRGAFVARTEEADIDDIIHWFAKNEVELKDCFEVRSAIEPLSIKLAIERCTKADVAQIEKTHQSFLRAVKSGNAFEIAKYDERFHNQIIEKSYNKLLISINKRMSEFIQSFRGKTFQLQQNVLNAVEPHSNIMRALQQRNAQEGEQFMRDHIQRIIDDLELNIKQ
ncbi:FadR family transcriptional regulator [Ruminococcaceae bacterium OttesenSCG-928-A16]|nr:FadR family transcriptional regulator [Ruminococcaceae bacterium OttesenSCG-928-A16]